MNDQPASHHDIARMRLGVLDALGMALADAAENGTDIAAALGGKLDGGEPILPYPSARETHGYIEAVYMLREETALHDDEVVSIVCAVPVRVLAALGAQAANTQPKTAHEAKGSLPWCVAAALVLNKINRDAFTPEALCNPRILALAKKVSCAADPQMPDDESRVTVNRVRGKPVECVVTVSLGSENNDMTAGQVYDKFRDNMIFAGLRAKTDAAIAAVENMKTPSNTRELLGLFSKP